MEVVKFDILNEKECAKIVRKSLKLATVEGIRLKRYDVTRGANELVGFMGEYYMLDAFYEEVNQTNTAEQHKRYFIKSLPILNELHRDECLRKGFFVKESTIYSEILCNLQRFAPTKLFAECYYTRKDIIVLEDLFTAKENLRHIKKDEEFSLEHHRVVLRLFAKLHAASLAWEREANFKIDEQFKEALYELQLSMANEWYVTGIKGILFLAKMHEKFKTPEYLELIEKKLYSILTNACALTEPSKKLQNVVCHRDTWDRNIFFEYNKEGVPVDCRIVDFQLSRYCLPGTDVLFFLYVTADSKRRPLIYNDCLNYYYEHLIKSFEALELPRDAITKADFLEGCKRARLAVLILWAICEPLMKMPEGLSNKWRAEEEEKFDFYMNTQRDEMFLRVMDMDASYREKIMTPIEELLDYLLQNKELCDEFC